MGRFGSGVAEAGRSVAMAGTGLGEEGLEPEDLATADKDLTWPKRRGPPLVDGQATDPMNLSHELLAIWPR